MNKQTEALKMAIEHLHPPITGLLTKDSAEAGYTETVQMFIVPKSVPMTDICRKEINDWFLNVFGMVELTYLFDERDHLTKLDDIKRIA